MNGKRPRRVTLMRPLGGWLADRFGGVRVLVYILAAVSALGLLMLVRPGGGSRHERTTLGTPVLN